MIPSLYALRMDVMSSDDESASMWRFLVILFYMRVIQKVSSSLIFPLQEK